MGYKYQILYRNYTHKWCSEYKTRWLILAIGKFLSLRGEYDIVYLSFQATE